MSLSKKTKWIISVLIIGLLFISFSVYRYQQVNKQFEDYAVIENTEKSGQAFSVHGLTYTLGKPVIYEETEQIQYELPVTVENRSDELKQLPYDKFHIRSNFTNNMLNRELFITNPLNQKRSKEGVLPNAKEQLILFFTMQKEWGVDLGTKADFYFIEFNGDNVIKHKLSVND